MNNTRTEKFGRSEENQKTITMEFLQWTNYFTINKTHFDHINWSEGNQLTTDEKKDLKTSLQQFQRGENSEGENLMRYAKVLGDEEYLNTIKIFIREEQSHAKVLGKFLTLNDIPKIRGHWIDDIFRKLRTLASLENSVLVLITAEIIAVVYYKALRDSSNSTLLQKLCEQILIDEELHINFQSFTLSIFHERRSFFGQWLKESLRKFLMAGTTILVWFTHGKVLKRGNYTFFKFWREVFEEYQRSADMICGKSQISIEPHYILRSL